MQQCSEACSCLQSTINAVAEIRLSSVVNAESNNIPGDAGIMVSGCYSSTGEAYMWGANTNSQLGRGDASAQPLYVFCLSLQTSAYISA